MGQSRLGTCHRIRPPQVRALHRLSFGKLLNGIRRPSSRHRGVPHHFFTGAPLRATFLPTKGLHLSLHRTTDQHRLPLRPNLSRYVQMYKPLRVTMASPTARLVAHTPSPVPDIIRREASLPRPVSEVKHIDAHDTSHRLQGPDRPTCGMPSDASSSLSQNVQLAL
jgi:hypothetical protein